MKRLKLCYVAETKVNPNLSLTLNDIEQMRVQGLAISRDMYAGEVSYNGTELGAEYRRGVTLNSLYERGIAAKSRLQSAGKELMRANTASNE